MGNSSSDVQDDFELAQDVLEEDELLSRGMESESFEAAPLSALAQRHVASPPPMRGRGADKILVHTDSKFSGDFVLDDHGHSHDDHGHTHDDHEHSHDDHGHSHDDHGHSHDVRGHSHDDHGHSHDDHGHSHDAHGHSHDDHGHSHDDHGHSHDDHEHSHDAQTDSYNDRAYLDGGDRQADFTPSKAKNANTGQWVARNVAAQMPSDRQDVRQNSNSMRLPLQHHSSHEEHDALDDVVPPYRGFGSSDVDDSSVNYRRSSVGSTSVEGSLIGAQTKSKQPKSLWSQLLAGDESSSEDDESGVGRRRHDSDDDEDEGPRDASESSAIKLLGAHLAKVKLEAEEQSYQLKQRIKKLEEEKLEQLEVLREANERSSKLEEQVKTLEVQNTRKWQIETRDHWIAQVETLKQERSKLKAENERMAESLSKLAMSVGGKSEGALSDAASFKQHLTRVLADLQDEKNKREALEKEVENARLRVDVAVAEAKALKKKLDFELELKWERTRKTALDESGSGSFIEMIGDVVAPRVS